MRTTRDLRLALLWAAALSFLAVSFGCSDYWEPNSIRFPYLWLDEPGFGGTIEKFEFDEPSGIVFHSGRGTLFVVSDEGEIAELTTEGELVFREPIAGDLEGITVVRQSGLLYIIIEADDIIVEYDPDDREVKRRFAINRTFEGQSNFLEKQLEKFDNGCESIAFVPDPEHPEGGTFFVGNQWDPPAILEVEVPLRSSDKVESEARIIRVLPVKLDDPAAMYFDFDTGLLNVVSDADNILIEVSLDGTLVSSYAFPADNQEGLTKDDQGNLYIAQDSGGIVRVKDLRGQID